MTGARAAPFDRRASRAKPTRWVSAVAGLLTIWVLSGCATEPADLPAPDLAAAAAQDENTLAAAEGDLAARRFRLAYDRLLKLQPATLDTPRARYAVAEAMLGLGQLNEALPVYRAIDQDPTFRPKALQGEGLCFMGLNDLAQAEPPLAAAVAADPSLWRGWNALGWIYDRQQRWAEAEQAYRQARAANPGSAPILSNYGVSLLLQQRYAEAESAFEQALAIDPVFDLAKGNLRLSLAWQGRYAEALAGLTPATASDSLNNVGYVAMQRGDYQLAQQYFTQALEGSPTYHGQAARNLEILKDLQARQAAAPTANGAPGSASAIAPAVAP